LDAKCSRHAEGRPYNSTDAAIAPTSRDLPACGMPSATIPTMQAHLGHLSDTSAFRRRDGVSAGVTVMRRASASSVPAATMCAVAPSFSITQRIARVGLTALALVLSSLLYTWQIHATLHR
jgi:hypothetical protein